ncbi:exportin-5 isoform X2 [Rana temporaria]|uniref:exportin-5 isoform X2 n=1 Tax=Rana temporaria TaxID=8407 RepID=UPI001AAC7B28|nr:exportin-5 isoform X2 [Rana temporaria]
MPVFSTCAASRSSSRWIVGEETPGKMAEQVQSLCEQLVRAVTIIMEPGSTQEHRLEALRFCEDFKETCPVCVPCGLHLAEKTQPPVVRHFGLQVLEHVVKFRWNDMEREEKVCLKDSVMGLIAGGIRPILEEEGHIKDVLARIVVEMIKREWPQHWPNMLSELDTLTKNGEGQAELVMFILLRLAEDVVTFQTLPIQRRRDIQTTMTQNMDKLFTFMLGILADSVSHYQQLKGDPTQKDKCQGLCRVALATLNTLAGYIDWVSIGHITAQDCKLLQMLCLLLDEEDLQVEAAECLLIAVGRRGKLEDRAPLLNLFADSPMHYIMTAAQKAHGEGLQEKRYVFLKRLCQVVCALGGQLGALTASPENKIKIPTTFDKYLKSLLDFTSHPSQFLKSSTIVTWGSLLRHDVLSKDHTLLAMVPELLRLSMSNIVRVGFPSRSDSPSCEYSRLDFDSDEDFVTFFTYFKAMVGDMTRQASRLNPHASFQMAAEWLKFLLSAPLDLGPNTSKAGEGLCTLFSPSYIQWEAMTFFSECVINQVMRVLQKEDLPVTLGMELLQIVLNYQTKDPLILTCLLTNLSALLPFVRYMNGLMPNVLTKLFSAVTFDLNNKGPRTRAVKAVRRHACSSIIRICRDTPELVLPHFNLLRSHAMLLFMDEHLTQMEKYSMLEVQVMISNHFNSYEKQQEFLAQLLGPATSVWSSQETQRAISSPDELISYLGAEVLKGLEEGESPCQANRFQLNLSLYAVEGVLRRARWPSDLEVAKAGGFVVGYTPDGNPIYRNPCRELALKFLDSIFSLVRTFNNLYLPEVLQKMGEIYAKCLDMMEAEKKCILGLMQPSMDTYDVPVYRSAEERMQSFFCCMYDSCCQVMGNLGPAMLQDFYSIPDLATRLVNSVFCNLSNVPDYRLRPMLRLFMKPFILSCPPERYESLLCPIMGPLLTFLHQRLSQKWLTSGEDYGDVNTESSEILEIELTRLLTREMVDLLSTWCVAKKTSEQSTIKAEVDGLRGANQAEAEDEMMSVEAPLPGSLELTELGKFLMSSEEVSSSLLISAFSPLVWMDTPACQKAANQLCWPLLKQVISGSLSSEAALCFFTNILRGLQTHGQHEGCNASLVNLAFQVYEALRPRFAELRLVMEQVPEVQLDSLHQFDTKLLSSGQKASEKKRKDQFRRLISGCIGKPLGEQFRKEVHIRNLPSLFQKKPRQVLEDSILGGCPEALPALFQQ